MPNFLRKGLFHFKFPLPLSHSEKMFPYPRLQRKSPIFLYYCTVIFYIKFLIHLEYIMIYMLYVSYMRYIYISNLRLSLWLFNSPNITFLKVHVFFTNSWCHLYHARNCNIPSGLFLHFSTPLVFHLFMWQNNTIVHREFLLLIYGNAGHIPTALLFRVLLTILACLLWKINFITQPD